MESLGRGPLIRHDELDAGRVTRSEGWPHFSLCTGPALVLGFGVWVSGFRRETGGGGGGWGRACAQRENLY